MAVCFLIFSYGLLRLILDEENSLDKKRAAIILAVYVAMCAAAVLAKWIMAKTQ